nr:ATPase subunit 9 [Lycium chinense]
MNRRRSCYNCFSESCCRYWKCFQFQHSVARNHSLAKDFFGYAILGFALTEAIALFSLMMAFLILLVF